MAEQPLCVDSLTCKTLLGIFPLGIDVKEAGLDRALFVAADAAEDDFSARDLRVESPRYC